MNDSDEKILTVREVSEYLRLTESTVYKLLQEKKLPGRKVGGQWRCSRRKIEDWLEKIEGEKPRDENEIFDNDKK